MSYGCQDVDILFSMGEERTLPYMEVAWLILNFFCMSQESCSVGICPAFLITRWLVLYLFSWTIMWDVQMVLRRFCSLVLWAFPPFFFYIFLFFVSFFVVHFKKNNFCVMFFSGKMNDVIQVNVMMLQNNVRGMWAER